MKEEVWMYLNSDLFLVVENNGLIDMYANASLIETMGVFGIELEDILFVSTLLGEL